MVARAHPIDNVAKQLASHRGQAWLGKSLESVDKSLSSGCDLRKVCEE